MLPVDSHVHTQWSWDTPPGSSMDRSCARALELGLPAVAFTEHLDWTRWGPHDSPGGGVPGAGGAEADADAAPRIVRREHVLPLDVDGYLADVDRCRSRYPSLRVITGIEAGEPHRFSGGVAAVLAGGAFERVLGSVHAVVDGDELIGISWLLQRRDPQAVMRAYFEELVRLIEGSDAFAVLAHADYPRRRWPGGEAGYAETDFEEEYRSVFRALAASGRALEVNTRSPLWSVDLVRWWYQEGGTAVSFGSDAHVPWRVGARFDLAVAVVEAAGFRPGRDPYDFWRR